MLKHALCALYPRTEYFPGIEDTQVGDFIRLYRRESSRLMLLGVYAAAALFVVSPLFTVYVPLPSFLLPRAMLDRHAERIANIPVYPLRSLIFLLKLVAGLCWGAHPAVRERLGLPPLPPDPQEWRTA